MERRVEVEKLRPGDINEETRRIVCGLLVNGVEFRSRGEPNIAKIMGYVYNANTVQTLQEIASREDSGLYVARQGQVALAATIISLQERRAPRYDEPDKPDNLMYMGYFGVATNDDAWKSHFIDIIKQARSDLLGNKKVTGLGAYVSVGDDNELPRAVRNLSPDTYRVFGGEAGVYGTVDSAPGHYRLHTVEFTKSVGRAGLTGLARELLEGRLSHRDTRLDPGRYAPAAPKREGIPVPA